MAESVPTNVHAIRGAIRRLAEGDGEAKEKAKEGEGGAYGDGGEGSCEEEFCVLLGQEFLRYANADSNVVHTCSVPSSVCKSCYAIPIHSLREPRYTYELYAASAEKKYTCVSCIIILNNFG